LNWYTCKERFRLFLKLISKHKTAANNVQLFQYFLNYKEHVLTYFQSCVCTVYSHRISFWPSCVFYSFK